MKSIIYILLATIYLLLCAPLFDWWCNTWLGGLLGEITPTAFHDVLIMWIAVFGCIAAWWLPKTLSETGVRWGKIIALGLIYILAVESVAFNDRFVHFYFAPWFRYTDIIILIGLLFVAATKIKADKNQNKNDEPQSVSYHLYYDDMNEVDFLNRADLVENLYDRLTKTKRNKDVAISLAITGGWGSGKSWLLEHLQNKLKEKEEICITFKPWLYGEADMTRSFYQTLARQLNDKDINVLELKKAIADIDNDELVGLGRAFLSLFGIVTKNANRERLVDNIKKKLSELNRPIYVFVDDCDRLAKKELMQVLGMIRNTGDFPGLTYMMAFDKKVVGEIIGYETGMNYVEKMINLTIDLPPVNDEVIADYLNHAATDILGKHKTDNNPFNRIPITRYLPTVREAKKYLNLLQNDCKRLHHRFEKHHFNDSDFCLVELLKYRYPDFYYSLQTSPKKYLLYDNENWNSPAGLPHESALDGDKDLLRLLEAMFRNIKDSSNPYDIIGAANKDYFPLYFDMELDENYVDAEEFNKAVQEENLPQKIGEWIDGGYTGVMGLLCAAHGSMKRKDVFLSLIQFIWHQCDRIPGKNTLGALTYGYDGKNVRHGFKSIMDVIKKYPQIELLTFHHLTDTNNQSPNDDMDAMIQEGKYLLELMGIWLNELRSVKDTDYPYEEVRYYVETIWKRILEQADGDTVGTLDVIDILGECTLEDTFNSMVLPLVIQNPQRWLGATVLQLKDKDKDYYLLKNRGVQAIFGSLAKMYGEINKIVTYVADENKDYVNAYSSLINNMAYTLKNNTDLRIFEKDRYSALASGTLLGSPAMLPLKAAILRCHKESFWQGREIRIHREESTYYFDEEV